MAIAGHALKANITTLGPLVLPISEQLIFFGNLVARKVCGVVFLGSCGMVNIVCCESDPFCLSFKDVTLYSGDSAEFCAVMAFSGLWCWSDL